MIVNDGQRGRVPRRCAFARRVRHHRGAKRLLVGHPDVSTLPIGADATVNLTLPLAGVVRTDDGECRRRPSSEVARSQPSSVVTKRDIDTLPLLDRNFLVLAQLLPGSGPINSTVDRLATTKFGGVADQRAGYTTLIDGGDINDTVWGSPTINVGEDAIQEFKVFRNQFDAQYGHALNAVVTVATRSGTNRFSGTRLLLRPRRRAERAVSVFGRESAVRRAADRRIRWRSAACATAVTSSSSYERDNVDTVRVIALAPTQSDLPRRERCLSGGDGQPHGQREARSSVRRRASLFGPVRVRPSAVAARQRRRPLSDSSQVDILNRSHSLVVEETWSATAERGERASACTCSTITLGTFPRDNGLAIRRPSVTRGMTNADAWVVPVTQSHDVGRAVPPHVAQRLQGGR